MMNPLRLKCMLANRLWKASSVSSYRRFRASLGNTQKVQQTCLGRLLQANSDSLYGRQWDFHTLTSVADFQARLPLTTYEDYLPYVEKIATGEQNVLTRDEVQLFVPSSGSSSARKLIPYTAALKGEFQAAIGPWMVALHNRFPELAAGRAYWSISPPNGQAQWEGKLRVGFEHDSAYLGRLGQCLHSWASVAPRELPRQAELRQFRNETLACMLTAADLSLISVWSPSYLRLLLDWYLANTDEVRDVMLNIYPKVSSHRLRQLDNAMKESAPFESIWPDLKVISCWADAGSRLEAERLQQYFPNTAIHKKGLLATEGVVSIPFEESCDPVLAVRSHFYEFLAENGDCLLAHQLERGRSYSVVLTTGGGLYRYRLEDQVLVTGFVGRAPTLIFEGKSECVADLYGEKLNARHVFRILAEVLNGTKYKFAMLAPDSRKDGCSYTMYLESDDSLPDDLPEQLDSKLRDNPQYECCVSLGQLSPARVYRVAEDACAAYMDHRLKSGMVYGDIKLTPLSQEDGWAQCFSGEYME
jgi:GH3 auxin-responsive promoter